MKPLHCIRPKADAPKNPCKSTISLIHVTAEITFGEFLKMVSRPHERGIRSRWQAFLIASASSGKIVLCNPIEILACRMRVLSYA